MIDLTGRLGFEARFEPKGFNSPDSPTIEYGKNVFVPENAAWEKTLGADPVTGKPLWSSLMVGYKYTDKDGNITGQPDLEKLWPDGKSFYFGHRGVFVNDKNLLGELKKHELRPDVTILPAGTIGRHFGNEFVRTSGHRHPRPELYQNIGEEENLFMQWLLDPKNPRRVSDAFAVKARPGDIVLILPGYEHITINPGDKGLLVVDWMYDKEKSFFGDVTKNNGPPCWTIEDGRTEFVKNPRYESMPALSVKRPNPKLSEMLGLKPGESIFEIAKQGRFEALDFLKDAAPREWYADAFLG